MEEAGWAIGPGTAPAAVWALFGEERLESLSENQAFQAEAVILYDRIFADKPFGP
jgi:hypothetical protein